MATKQQISPSTLANDTQLIQHFHCSLLSALSGLTLTPYQILAAAGSVYVICLLQVGHHMGYTAE